MQSISNYWKSSTGAKIIILVCGFLLICVACSVLIAILPSSKPATPAVDLTAVFQTADAQARQAITQTAVASLPTNTPTVQPPTKTPAPTVTPTSPPNPITLTGSGDSVLDISKWDGPAILKATYQGGSNFIVENYGDTGNLIDLLINEIGNYKGTLPIDFLDGEKTTRLAVTAAGPWEFQIQPLDYARHENIPGTISGVGSDVVILSSGTPDLLKADASQASSNFIILGFGTHLDLVINEIAPYTGTVILSSDTVLLSIEATGPWSIEITTK